MTLGQLIEVIEQGGELYRVCPSCCEPAPFGLIEHEFLGTCCVGCAESYERFCEPASTSDGDGREMEWEVVSW